MNAICRFHGCNEPATTVAMIRTQRPGASESRIEVPACAAHKAELEKSQLRLVGGTGTEQR